MMLVCGIDTETTGLDFKADWVIEIAAVLFDGKTWEPKEQMSVLINRPEAFPVKCTEIHHITDEMLVDQGVSAFEAYKALEKMGLKADFLIAHNASFDAQMIGENINRTPGLEISTEFLRRPWLCSKKDVRTHYDRRCTRLSHLAVDYGCIVDGSKLHRALDDVLLMGQVLQKTGLSVVDINTWKQEPWVYLEALVEKPWLDNGRSRDLAKADGYVWESYGSSEPKFEKKWIKKVKQGEFDKEKQKNVSFKRLTLKLPESGKTS